ncbi:MAG: ribonuclease H [Myxococcota bacterium]
MSWTRMKFKKKQKIWVRLAAGGELDLDGKGYAFGRYKNEDDQKLYSIWPANLAPLEGYDAPELPEGTSAEASSPAAAPVEEVRDAIAAGALYVSTEVPDDLVGVPEPAAGVIDIHTDGACQGNPGPCSLGVVIRFGAHYKEMSQFLGQGTNNIAELTAIKVALESLKREDLPVHLHTDSSYSIGVLSKGWKARANKELIADIRRTASAFDELRFIKVKGHSGLPLNERVDRLAVAAIEAWKVQQTT